MRSEGRFGRVAAAVAAAGLVAAWAAGAGATGPAAQAVNVQLNGKAGVGGFLSDAAGKTLYVFAKDARGGRGTCVGECAEKWPPFFLESIVAASGLPKQEFRVVNRDDGKKQVAFRGFPLYYFSGDKEPGETKGDGVNGKWFVAKVPFYTVMLSEAPNVGTFLTGPEGRTLYAAKADPKGGSACEGDCLKTWTPFFQSRLVLPAGLAEADFETIVRADGKKQVAYKGHALYWNTGDRKPNEAKGAGVDGWFVADPAKLQ